VRRADNLTTLMCRLPRNPGALTSRTPQGHVGLFRGYFTFIFYIFIVLYVRIIRMDKTVVPKHNVHQNFGIIMCREVTAFCADG
jgi:hypothetical protein